MAPLVNPGGAETGAGAVEGGYGGAAELAATMAEEGDGSPADISSRRIRGRSGRWSRAGLLAALPRSAVERVAERFRGPKGPWIGPSGRAHVIAVNTRGLGRRCPHEILSPTDAAWKERWRRADERVLPGVRHGDAAPQGEEEAPGWKASRRTASARTRGTGDRRGRRVPGEIDVGS